MGWVGVEQGWSSSVFESLLTFLPRLRAARESARAPLPAHMRALATSKWRSDDSRAGSPPTPNPPPTSDKVPRVPSHAPHAISHAEPSSRVHPGTSDPPPPERAGVAAPPGGIGRGLVRHPLLLTLCRALVRLISPNAP